MAARTPEQRRKLARIAIVAIGLLIVVNLLIIGGSQHDDNAGPVLPAEIERLFPDPQQVIRPQDTVGADLRDDLQGVLYVNNAPVPDDQVGGDPNLGLITFRPGCAGSRAKVPADQCEFREFDPGTLNLKVEYWPRTEDIDAARRNRDVATYGWQIKVG